MVYDTEVKTNATFLPSAKRQRLRALHGRTQRIRLQKHAKRHRKKPIFLHR
jgi:hypothetical protein